MLAGLSITFLFLMTLFGAWFLGRACFRRGSLDLSLGVLSFVAFYACLRFADVSGPNLTFVCGGLFLGLGCAGIFVILRTRFTQGIWGQQGLLVRILACLFGWSLGRWIPLNPHSLDLKHYAMEQAWAFAGSRWIHATEALHPHGLYLYNLMLSSRTGVGAFGWISSLPAVTLDRGFVMQLILAWLGLTIVEWWSLVTKTGLRRTQSRWLWVASLPLLLNPNHVVAAFLGGHINQVLGGLGLVVVVRLLSEMGDGQRERLWAGQDLAALAICGMTLLLVYPEMGMVLPIYFLGASALYLRGRAWFFPLLSLGLGFAIPALFRLTELREFLSGQISAGVQWAPMVGFARNPICYTSLLLHGGYHKFLVPFLLVTWLILFRVVVNRRRISRELILFGVSFIGLSTFAILKAGEAHYMVFKLSGWLLPLFAVMWLSVMRGWWESSADRRARIQQRFVICVGVLALLIGLMPLRGLWNFGERPPPLTFVDSSETSGVQIRPIHGTDLVYSEDWSRVHAPTRGLRVEVVRE